MGEPETGVIPMKWCGCNPARLPSVTRVLDNDAHAVMPVIVADIPITQMPEWFISTMLIGLGIFEPK